MSNSFSQSVQDFLRLYLPIKTISSIGFIFGIYFPSQCSKLIRNVKKLYCIFVSVIVPIFTVLVSSWSYPTTYLYFSSAIWVALLVDGNCLMQYRAAVDLTDRAMRHTQQRIEIKISYVLLFLMILCRSIFGVTNFSGFTCVTYYFFTFIHISIDFSNLTRMFIFDIFYERIKLLRESFETIFINSSDNLITLTDKIRKVKLNMILYKQRLDDFQVISNRVQASLFTAIVACFINGMAQIENMVYYSGNPAIVPEFNLKIVTTLCELVFRCLVICVPSLFTELSSEEMEKVNRILVKQLHKCSDEELRRVITISVRYLQLRPFRFRIWRAVPVDSSLIIAYFNLIFTFTFMIFQYHHYI